jgi:hypothetical protein
VRPMTDIPADVARLESDFPLRPRQLALDERERAVHRAILDSFCRRGLPPDELDPSIVGTLADNDLIVVEEGSVVGAYPFSLRSTDHHLLISGTVRIDAMCAFDAVAVAPVWMVDTEINSTCAHTGVPIRVTQAPDPVAEPSAVHLGIRWQAPCGSASVSMCREMVFLADAGVARAWKAAGPEASIYTLEEGVEFGRLLFAPLRGPRPQSLSR